MAPQYRNTGLPSAFAVANTASTSPVCHAMPWSAAAAAWAGAADADLAAGGAGSGAFEQAAASSDNAITDAIVRMDFMEGAAAVVRVGEDGIIGLNHAPIAQTVVDDHSA